MATHDRPNHEPDEVDPDRPDANPELEALTLKGGFGTALGAAMLGFEQALRNEPPAEILAAEHMPERGASGQSGDVVIEFPDRGFDGSETDEL